MFLKQLEQMYLARPTENQGMDSILVIYNLLIYNVTFILLLFGLSRRILLLGVYVVVPAEMFSPFLSTAPLQYVPKMLFTQATIDCLINKKTKNALHKETVILNYIGDDPISHSLIN